MVRSSGDNAVARADTGPSGERATDRYPIFDYSDLLVLRPAHAADARPALHVRRPDWLHSMIYWTKISKTESSL